MEPEDYEKETLINFCVAFGSDTAFTREAAQNMIGTKTTFRDIKGDTHPAEIVAARTIDNGRAINITLKVDDPTQTIKKSFELNFDNYFSFSPKIKEKENGKN